MTHLRELMLQELQRRNYSQTTATSYSKIVADFAKSFSDRRTNSDRTTSGPTNCIYSTNASRAYER